MNTGIKESKILTKHTSCECRCSFKRRKWNSNQRRNKDNWCQCKNKIKHRVCEKGSIWNPATCSCENGKYVGSFIDDSVISCDEIIGKKKRTSKTLLTKSTSTKSNSKDFYILLTFLLITKALSIVVSVYCYLIKYRALMGNKFNDIDIKYLTHYFFDEMMNIKNFDGNQIKIDDMCIGYVFKDLRKCLNHLYLIIVKINGCFEKVMEVSI